MKIGFKLLNTRCYMGFLVFVPVTIANMSFCKNIDTFSKDESHFVALGPKITEYLIDDSCRSSQMAGIMHGKLDMKVVDKWFEIILLHH